MASNRSAFFLMRLFSLVSGLYPHRRDVRMLIPETHTRAARLHIIHTHTHQLPHTHACTPGWMNGNTANIPYALRKRAPAPRPICTVIS